MISIRKAETDDVSAIWKLHRKVVSEVNSLVYSPDVIMGWLGELSEGSIKRQFQNSIWLVAEIGGSIVGFGQYSVKDGQIYQINVDPARMGRNVGRRLYDYIESDFRLECGGFLSEDGV